MSRSLKLYIAGVVTACALALIVTTLVFPARPEIALRFSSVSGAAPLPLEIFAGVAFWVILTILASAMPVQLTQGTQVAVTTDMRC